MIAMNAAEIKQIIIAGIMITSVTILGCMKIINGESIVWVIGMIAGYVLGSADNKISKK
jgi:hypothetical protein